MRSSSCSPCRRGSRSRRRSRSGRPSRACTARRLLHVERRAGVRVDDLSAAVRRNVVVMKSRSERTENSCAASFRCSFQWSPSALKIPPPRRSWNAGHCGPSRRTRALVMSTLDDRRVEVPKMRGSCGSCRERLRDGDSPTCRGSIRGARPACMRSVSNRPMRMLEGAVLAVQVDGEVDGGRRRRGGCGSQHVLDEGFDGGGLLRRDEPGHRAHQRAVRHVRDRSSTRDARRRAEEGQRSAPENRSECAALSRWTKRCRRPSTTRCSPRRVAAVARRWRSLARARRRPTPRPRSISTAAVAAVAARLPRDVASAAHARAAGRIGGAGARSGGATRVGAPPAAPGALPREGITPSSTRAVEAGAQGAAGAGGGRADRGAGAGEQPPPRTPRSPAATRRWRRSRAR